MKKVWVAAGQNAEANDLTKCRPELVGLDGRGVGPIVDEHLERRYRRRRQKPVTCCIYRLAQRIVGVYHGWYVVCAVGFSIVEVRPQYDAILLPWNRSLPRIGEAPSIDIGESWQVERPGAVGESWMPVPNA